MTRHFCLCLSLKTGAIIMSFLNLLEGSVEVVVAIIELSNADPEKKLHRIAKKVNVVEKACNATKWCNETTIHKTFPPGEPGFEGTVTLFIVCLLVGLLSLISGVLLLIGLMQAKEKYVLWYVLLGSIPLFIATIFSGIYMFDNGVLFVIFVLSLFMCYGQLAMYYFYEEVTEYNTVKSGVIEISYNGDAKSYANSVVSVDNNVDNTAL